MSDRLLTSEQLADFASVLRTRNWDTVECERILEHIRALDTARTEAFTAGFNAAREMAVGEADRFLDSLKGRKNDRDDGAFIAIARLAGSIRALQPNKKGIVR